MVIINRVKASTQGVLISLSYHVEGDTPYACNKGESNLPRNKLENAGA